MATKFYLLNKTADYSPATLRGAWDDTVAAVTKALSTSKYYGGAMTTSLRAESNTTNDWDMLLFRGVTGPLAAQTLSGTLDVMLGVWETNAGANSHFHIHAYVTQGDSDTPRGTIITDATEALGVNEWGATSAANALGRTLNAAISLSSLAISAGDRIVVEIGCVNRNVTATNIESGLYYGTSYPDLLTGYEVARGDLTAGGAAVTLAGFLTFSNTITENDSTARVTRESVRTLSVGAADARVSRLSVRTLSRGAIAEGRVTRLSVRTMSIYVPPAPAGGNSGVFLGDVSGGPCWVE